MRDQRVELISTLNLRGEWMACIGSMEFAEREEVSFRHTVTVRDASLPGAAWGYASDVVVTVRRISQRYRDCKVSDRFDEG